MKKLSIVLCLLAVLVFQNIDASAISKGESFELSSCQYENDIGLMSSDVIEYKFREYKNRLQYRRWNATRKFWVDPYWIYA